MLDWLYAHFGFWGSLLFLWFVIFMIIFWLAGMAGIMLLPASKIRTFKLVIGIVFPPFTVGWMIYDMFQQKRALRGND